MATSRLKSNIKRQAIHNVILVVCGFIILIIVLAFFGSNLLTSFSLFVENSQGNNDTNATANTQTDSYISPPSLNPLSNATNKPQIDISGFGQKPQTIILYVNGQLMDKTDVSDNNQFHFSSVQLQQGQNTIKVKAQDGNKQSDFSNADTISYLKNPPHLTITNPQDGQGFSKSSSPSVNIEGTTDASANVTVNGSWAIVDDQGKYSFLYTLKDEDNDIKVVATDNAGNQTTKEIHIHTQ
jgi:hypothetical protein